MADFNNTVKFFKSLYNLKERGEKTLEGSQISFGCILEQNFLNALKFCEEANYVKVQKTSSDYNKMFGADAYIEFTSPINKKIDHMSCFLDTTLYKSRDTIRFAGGKRLCKLDNGLWLTLSYKHNHSGFFKYRKPIIMIEFEGDKYNAEKIIDPYKYVSPSATLLTQDITQNISYTVPRIKKKRVHYGSFNPIFTERDIKSIVNHIRQACMYLSYKLEYWYQGESHTGTCKYASTEIDINKDMLEAILKEEGVHNDTKRLKQLYEEILTKDQYNCKE